MNRPPETPGARQPEQPAWSQTENLRGILVELEGPGDTTVRPARSPLVRQVRPDQPRQPPSESK